MVNGTQVTTFILFLLYSVLYHAGRTGQRCPLRQKNIPMFGHGLNVFLYLGQKNLPKSIILAEVSELTSKKTMCEELYYYGSLTNYDFSVFRLSFEPFPVLGSSEPVILVHTFNVKKYCFYLPFALLFVLCYFIFLIYVC